MKKLFRGMTASFFLIAILGMTIPAWGQIHAREWIGPLVAGQNTEVGTVTASFTLNGDLQIAYALNTDDFPGYVITEIHFNLGVPKKSAPGQFTYSMEFDPPGVTAYRQLIPADEVANYLDADGCFNLAAHAVVAELGGLDGLAYNLPDSVTGSVQHPGTNGESYFTTTVSGGSLLDGVYAGFCVDTDHTISPGRNYTMAVYSSYEDLPEGTVEFPEYLPLVNYILNQGYVGQPAFDASGNYLGDYTYGDVQRAIWALIEDGQSTAGLGSWSQARVDLILADAMANGVDFIPGCGDQVAIILVPIDANGNVAGQITLAQVTIIGLDLPCETIDETAWAIGSDGEFTPFSKNGHGWGGYNYVCIDMASDS